MRKCRLQLKCLFVGLILFLALSANAATFYVKPNGSSAWANLTSGTVKELAAGNLIASFASIDAAATGADTYYFAPGTYPTAGLLITTGKIYGGFTGNETVIDLAVRPTSDLDGNSIIEPWEFSNETIITTNNDAYKFTGVGITSGNRLLTVSGTGGEVNGVTLTDFNYTGFAGAISIGLPATTPSVANNTLDKAGILRLCTVKRIKTNTAGGAVMLTNKYSLVDRCLIENTVTTAGSAGGAICLNSVGGKVSGCVVRNNISYGSNGTNGNGGGIYATSTASIDMDAIIENCVVYNNYATGNGGGIRGNAQANKRGIEIINSTIVNNLTGATTGPQKGTVELISGGSIVNSIVVGDGSAELRPNTTNNYILSNAYGEYTTETTPVLYGSNNVSGKLVADFNFQNPTNFPGVMIPDYTTPFDQAKYDAIRHANFKIASLTSVAVTATSTKTYPSSYQIGGAGATITLSTYTVPTTDILGTTRPSTGSSAHYDLGAYQYSSVATSLKSTDAAISRDVFATIGGVSVTNAKGQEVRLYNYSGQLVKSEVLGADLATLKIEKGLYIVKVGSKTAKVVVK